MSQHTIELAIAWNGTPRPDGKILNRTEHWFFDSFLEVKAELFDQMKLKGLGRQGNNNSGSLVDKTDLTNVVTVASYTIRVAR